MDLTLRDAERTIAVALRGLADVAAEIVMLLDTRTKDRTAECRAMAAFAGFAIAGSPDPSGRTWD